eukprot:365700-Chlamydomonas_euryale.AAC.7
MPPKLQRAAGGVPAGVQDCSSENVWRLTKAASVRGGSQQPPVWLPKTCSTIPPCGSAHRSRQCGRSHVEVPSIPSRFFHQRPAQLCPSRSPNGPHGFVHHTRDTASQYPHVMPACVSACAHHACPPFPACMHFFCMDAHIPVRLPASLPACLLPTNTPACLQIRLPAS